MTLQIPMPLPALRSADPFAADPAHPFIPREFQRLAAGRAKNRRPVKRKNPKIVHLIGALGAGGAERQLVTLVTALKDRRQDVSVLTLEPLEANNAFRLPALTAHHVPAAAIDRSSDPALTLGHLPHIADLLRELPNWLKPWPFQIAQTLAADPPDILHIWLDFTNITGTIAGLLLGIPHIILSTRSVNPTHFSYMNTPWFKPWYSFLAAVPDLVLLNNSLAGQADYAAWMGLSPSRFGVIRNGIDTDRYSRIPAPQIADFRRELGLADTDLLLTGVFRLSEEKRPLLFLEIAAAVMRNHPRVHALLLGHGPMESQVRGAIANSGLAGRIHLLAPRNDMPVVYAASEVLLQTSILEGTPNTLLEAQAAGCPVVSTPGGGAGECLLDGDTGFLADSAEALAERVCLLLADAAVRQRFAAAGRAFVRERFGLERMVGEYDALYRKLR